MLFLIGNFLGKRFWMLGRCFGCNLGTFSILEAPRGKSREQMITCDVLWWCDFEQTLILHWFASCFGEWLNQGFGIVEGRDFKTLISRWFDMLVNQLGTFHGWRTLNNVDCTWLSIGEVRSMASGNAKGPWER